MKLPEFKRPKGGRPDVKVPGVVSDLYADLRDRRLLPLVALLVVAIIAAPILIGSGKKERPVAQTSIVAHAGVDETGFSVVPAENQLQEYKKRLPHRKSVNPFNAWSAVKKRTPSKAEIARAVKARREQSTGGTQAVPQGAGDTNRSESGQSEPSRSTTTVIEKPKVVKATVKAQVGVAAIVKAGFDGSEPKELELEDQTKLPPNSPAIVYDGTGRKDGALFLMTSQVTEFTGEGHCVLGGSLCQVVELRIGQKETFAIGYGDSRYTVRLVGFAPIVKEEVIEAEGRKVRVPNHRSGRSEGQGNGGDEEEVGAEPSPRWLLP